MNNMIAYKECDSLSLLAENNRILNVVKSAVYQWLQFFDSPATKERMCIQKELMDDGIILISSFAIASGKDNFERFYEAIADFEPSFQVLDFNVFPVAKAKFSVNGRVNCLIQQKEQVRFFALYFFADLYVDEQHTVKFLNFKLKNIEHEPKKLEKQCLSNRINALIYKGMSLVELQTSETKSLDTTFSDEFKVFTTTKGVLTRKFEIIEWIDELHIEFTNLTFAPANVKYRLLEPNEIEVSFDLLIEGITEDGNWSNSLCKNIWIITDNTDEIFPRINSIRVEPLEPIFI